MSEQPRLEYFTAMFTFAQDNQIKKIARSMQPKYCIAATLPIIAAAYEWDPRGQIGLLDNCKRSS